VQIVLSDSETFRRCRSESGHDADRCVGEFLRERRSEPSERNISKNKLRELARFMLNRHALTEDRSVPVSVDQIFGYPCRMMGNSETIKP
jgi:hypothetical protein